MRRRLFPLLTACAPCRITHWCYNPLVLRRRTCCPVSNTLFFFFFFSFSLSFSFYLSDLCARVTSPRIVLWRQIYRYPICTLCHRQRETQYSLLRCTLTRTGLCWIETAGINERLTLALLRCRCMLPGNSSTLTKKEWQLDVIFWRFERDEPIFLKNLFMLCVSNHKRN